MKYSKAKQNLHIEVIRQILAEDPDISARMLWKELEKRGYHLNRKYATKLLWRACDAITTDKKAKAEKQPEILEWYRQLKAITADFDKLMTDVEELKSKLRRIIHACPYDLPDSERYWL